MAGSSRSTAVSIRPHRSGPSSGGCVIDPACMSEHPVGLSVTRRPAPLAARRSSSGCSSRSRTSSGSSSGRSATFFAAIAGWVVALVTRAAPGRAPPVLLRLHPLHRRTSSPTSTLVADPYPAFSGRPLDGYPVDVTLPEPAPQRAARVLVPVLLAIPALILSATLAGGGASVAFSRGGRTHEARPAGTSAAWPRSRVPGLVRLAREGRDAARPPGRRRLRARLPGAGLRVSAARHRALPELRPARAAGGLEPPPLHPVRLDGDAHDLRRSRLTVFFRLPLLIPHLFWLGSGDPRVPRRRSCSGS